MRLQTNKGGYVRYKPLPMEECSGTCDGVTRTWKEYVPSRYDGSQKLPLVISLHGGALKPGTMHTGERSNAFTHVAEKYGFIVAYAQSVVDGICWNVWEMYGDEFGMQYKNDIVYLDWLIDTMCSRYAIDESRIYLYGHSYGDVMATEYALKRAERLAAAALFCGPSNASTFTDPDGTFRFGSESALPVLRYHGSEDLDAPSGKWPHAAEHVLSHCNPTKTLISEEGGVTDRVRKLKMELTQMPNILLWSSINEALGLPEFSLCGDVNIASYRGTCDFHYACFEHGGHFPPAWAAEWIWKYFFSHHANCKGERVHLAGEAQLPVDRSAVIVAAGASYAYVGRKLVQLDREAIVDGTELYVTKHDAAQLLGAGALIASEEVPESSESSVPDGYVSLRRCAEIAGLAMTTSRGVAYISANTGTLSYDFCYLMQACLGAERSITARDCCDIEREQLIRLGIEPLQ